MFLGEGGKYLVDQEIFEMIDLNSEHCNESIAYDYDACKEDQFFKVFKFISYK